MLTDAHIRNAKPVATPVKLTDANGLYIEIRPTGTKLWRYRYRLNGRENVFALGEYPGDRIPVKETLADAEARKNVGIFTLQEARSERERCRRLVKQGIHPAHERKLERIRQANDASTTFAAVLAEWVANRHWAASTLANRLSQIEMHLLPTLGALPVRQITPAHVLDVLRRAEKQSIDTRTRVRGSDSRTVGGGTVVRRLRQTISGVFDHAIATLRADTNPAGPIRSAFKEHRETHKTPLVEAQIGQLLRALDDYGGHFQTGVALRLLWLTLARPSEMAGARWAEFDLEAATWTIPPVRMKMSEEHVIPLPVQAIELLTRMNALSGHAEHVFQHRDDRSRPMTYAALHTGIARLALPFKHTPHGARTTASTLLNTMGYRGEVIEHQLAHQERNASRRAYNRATYLAERRVMMQAWADLLDVLRSGQEKEATGKFKRSVA